MPVYSTTQTEVVVYRRSHLPELGDPNCLIFRGNSAAGLAG